MSYWVYEGWRVESRAVIHDAECGMCNDGQGFHGQPLGNDYGKWHGPYATLDLAEKAAVGTKRPVRQHSCVEATQA